MFLLTVYFRPDVAVFHLVGLAICGFESLLFTGFFMNHALTKNDFENVWIFVKCGVRIRVAISLLTLFCGSSRSLLVRDV